MLNRRELIAGAFATGVTRQLPTLRYLGQKSGAYFAEYTLGGLMMVAAGATSQQDQGNAAKLLRDRMAFKGYDNLVATEDGVCTYRRPVTVEMIVRHPIAAIERGSYAYEALVRDIPKHSALVRKHLAYTLFVPIIRLDLDPSVSRFAACTLFPDSALVKSLDEVLPSTAPHLRGLLVHEAEHLANPKLPLLLTERNAAQREWETLIEHRNATGDTSLDARISQLNGIVMRADYLKSLGDDFLKVYPASITGSALLQAKIPRETLEKHAKRTVKNPYDQELANAIREALNPPTERVFVVDETKPSSTMVLSIGPERIPDLRDGDRVLEI